MAGSGTESREIRIKRLRMRSWRRGTREMDLILGPFADHHLKTLSSADLDAYEDLLGENDRDLQAWVGGTAEADARHRPLIALISKEAFSRRPVPSSTP